MNAFTAGLLADRYVLAGAISGVLSLLAFVPYIRSTLAGRTKPDRASWLIWSVLATLSGASNFYEGASASMFFVGAQVFGTLVVFGLSIPFGSGKVFSRLNLVILGIAAIGVISWAMTHTAVYALGLSIMISALGAARTVSKSYATPDSESGAAWFVLALSAAFGVYSVGSLDGLLLAYPVYLFALYGVIVIAMGLGHIAQQDASEAAARIARRQNVPPVRAAKPYSPTGFGMVA